MISEFLKICWVLFPSGKGGRIERKAREVAKDQPRRAVGAQGAEPQPGSGHMASAPGLRGPGRPLAVLAQSPRAAARLPLGDGSNELDSCLPAASTLPPQPSEANARPPPPPTTAAARRVESRIPQGAQPALFSREVGKEEGWAGDGDRSSLLSL